jgi:membrane protein YqaA with SNARE-associated domain
VTKLCIFVGTTIGSYVGWYLGDLCGLSFWGAFMTSGVGSVAGVYGGWKLARKLEE